MAVLVLPGAPLIPVHLAGGAFGLWEAFVITTQEPRIAIEEDPVTLRKVIRSCASAAFVGAILQSVARGSAQGLFLLIGTVLSWAGIVASFGELVYLRRFALRIPDEKLAKSTKTLLWLSAVGGTLLVLYAVSIFLVFSASGPPQPVLQPVPAGGTAPVATAPVGPGIATIVGCFGLLVGLVLFLWYVRLIYRYRDAFKQAAAESGNRIESVAEDRPAPV
jgi:hypothetical protein